MIDVCLSPSDTFNRKPSKSPSIAANIRVSSSIAEQYSFVCITYYYIFFSYPWTLRALLTLGYGKKEAFVKFRSQETLVLVRTTNGAFQKVCFLKKSKQTKQNNYLFVFITFFVLVLFKGYKQCSVITTGPALRSDHQQFSVEAVWGAGHSNQK